MKDDNIFDDDDALDYILYEEAEGDVQEKINKNSGCLIVFILILAPSLYSISLFLV